MTFLPVTSLADWPQLSTFVRESTSDGFCLLLYEGDSPTWGDAAKLVAGGEEASSGRFFVTSSDGETTVEVPHEEFLAAPHGEHIVTISADWLLGGAMDGYVLGTFKRAENKVFEHYQYGTLNELEAVCIDLVFARFTSIVDKGIRALLAIDASGSSTVEDWEKVYDSAGPIPATATVIVATIGSFQLVSEHLTPSVESDGMVILTPASGGHDR
jgi:hypothetical protein